MTKQPSDHEAFKGLSGFAGAAKNVRKRLSNRYDGGTFDMTDDALSSTRHAPITNRWDESLNLEIAITNREYKYAKFGNYNSYRAFEYRLTDNRDPNFIEYGVIYLYPRSWMKQDNYSFVNRNGITVNVIKFDDRDLEAEAYAAYELENS